MLLRSRLDRQHRQSRVSDVFVSYARSTESQARQIADGLRALGFTVWRDDELPPHRTYAEVIEERLRSARAVVVVWSADAVKSQWVRAEADVARNAGTLVQLSLDGTAPPLPFNQIQCVDIAGWAGDPGVAGWRKLVDSVRDLVGQDLSSPATAAAGFAPALPSKPSIAVLPFANLSNDPEQEYFADGMVVEIVTALSRFRSLFVIASGSSLSLKGKGLSPLQAAHQLGVRFVLEGSVRRAGGRVRISVQLVDAGDGTPVWTQRFDDTLDDVFALQDRVALSAAGVIEPAILYADARRSTTRPTENAGSYDLYLRALALVRSYDATRFDHVIELAERAIELDPSHAAAVALGVRCHYLASLYGWSGDAEPHRRRALELAEQALRLAGDDANTVAAVAPILAYLGRDLDGSIRLVERALELNPGSVTAWFNSGIVRVAAGDLALAIEHLETASRLDPIGPDRPSRMLFVAMARFQQRRFTEAAALASELFQHFNNPTGCVILAASYGFLGRPDDARAAIARYESLSPLTVEELAPAIWRTDAHLRLFLEGIALANGPSPVANAPAS
jgi:adenylate cyclase